MCVCVCVCVQQSSGSTPVAGFRMEPEAEPSPEVGEFTLEESLELTKRKIEAAEANPASGSGSPIFDSGDLAITLIILAIIFGGFAFFFFLYFYYLYRAGRIKNF